MFFMGSGLCIWMVSIQSGLKTVVLIALYHAYNICAEELGITSASSALGCGVLLTVLCCAFGGWDNYEETAKINEAGIVFKLLHTYLCLLKCLIHGSAKWCTVKVVLSCLLCGGWPGVGFYSTVTAANAFNLNALWYVSRLLGTLIALL